MSIKNEIVFMPGETTATVKLCKGKLATKIKNLAAIRDDCEILKQAGGYIVAHIPVTWIRVIVDRDLNERERARCEMIHRQQETRSQPRRGIYTIYGKDK